MPELPEVETIVRGLRRVLPGRAITAVHFGKTDFVDEPATLAATLPRQRIRSVERIGKFIVLKLAAEASPAGHTTPVNLIVHLGMTGRLAVWRSDEPPPPHTHATFDLDDGGELRYTDIRRFGRMLLLPEDAVAALRAKLGEDPLDISAEEFYRRLHGRRARIKALLLDQSVLRGVGNIYADESLWRARIHPARLAAQLTRADLLLLRTSLRQVLLSAIAHRGSSISDFLDAEGKPGSYQNRHRVYQRTGDPCARCGAPIQREIVAGRSSHFCPRCQRAPRPTRQTVSRTGHRTGGRAAGKRDARKNKSPKRK